MMQTPPLNIAYDSRADVLYISSRIPAHHGVEDEQGMVWRYDQHGELIGVTILDFFERWYPHRSELAHTLSVAFHIPEMQAKTMVARAVEQLRGS